MAENIESFVKKLKTEGVDAGKKAAEKIKRDARHEAEEILADAKNEADNIIAKAKKDAEKQLSRMQTELELAVRDSVLKFREFLNLALSALLTRRVENKLSDTDYLGEIIREVIVAYAKADAVRHDQMEINLSKKMRDKLNDRVLKDFFHNLKIDQDKMNLKATLSKAGFEYKLHGATVEVSADSVAELLSEMVNPSLQKTIDKVVGKQGGERHAEKRAHEQGKKSRPDTEDHKDHGTAPKGNKK
jgi:V/A-type H+-transporting ATPase subunit E